MDVALKVDSRSDEESLRVHYVLTNHGEYPLLCYDAAPGVPPDAEWPDATNQMYVSVVGNLLLLKRIYVPPPGGILVNREFIPPLSQTLPGESREVRFLLKMPVTERSEYSPDYSDARYQEHRTSRVELDIGCFWRQENTRLIPYKENAKAFKLDGELGPQSVVSGQCDAQVRVKQRTDAEFRRL